MQRNSINSDQKQRKILKHQGAEMEKQRGSTRRNPGGCKSLHHLAIDDDDTWGTNPAASSAVAEAKGLFLPDPPAARSSNEGPKGPIPDSTALGRPHHKAFFCVKRVTSNTGE